MAIIDLTQLKQNHFLAIRCDTCDQFPDVLRKILSHHKHHHIFCSRDGIDSVTSKLPTNNITYSPECMSWSDEDLIIKSKIKEISGIRGIVIYDHNIQDNIGDNELDLCKQYMDRYPDIVSGGFDTPYKALQHWKKYGHREGRVFHAQDIPQETEIASTHTTSPNLQWNVYGDNLIFDNEANKSHGTHFYGWRGAMDQLYKHIIENDIHLKKYTSTLYLDEWLERLAIWGNDISSRNYIMDTIKQNPIEMITFVHNPPFEDWETIYNNNTDSTLLQLKNSITHNPENFNGLLIQHSDSRLISNNNFYSTLDSTLLDKSKYIYTVSREHKKYLTRPDIISKYPNIKGKVLSVNHPITDNIKNRFNYDSFRTNKYKKIYHIGWWMRNLKSFNDIKLPKTYRKYMLVKRDFECFKDIIKPALPNMEMVSHLEDKEYIKIFQENLLFMDAFDVTASNLLLECIRCNTPIILKRLPAFEQYIGNDYPLFFNDLGDIECLNESALNIVIKQAHEHLKSLNKDHIDQQTFNRKISYDLSKLENDTNPVKLTWVSSLYNVDKFFKNMLHDFKSQNLNYVSEIEWIIVNIIDSNSKKTNREIRQAAKKHPNIKVINIKSNMDKGIYDCWNKAIAESTGKYISNFNSDDRRLQNFSREFIDFLDDNPGTDVAFAPVIATKLYSDFTSVMNSKKYDTWFDNYETCIPLDVNDFWNSSEKDTHNPVHSSPVWRRAIHNIAGNFDEDKYGSVADYALWLKCVYNNLNITSIGKTSLSMYYINETSYGRAKNIDSKKQQLLKEYYLI